MHCAVLLTLRGALCESSSEIALGNLGSPEWSPATKSCQINAAPSCSCCFPVLLPPRSLQHVFKNSCWWGPQFEDGSMGTPCSPGINSNVLPGKILFSPVPTTSVTPEVNLLLSFLNGVFYLLFKCADKMTF